MSTIDGGHYQPRIPSVRAATTDGYHPSRPEQYRRQRERAGQRRPSPVSSTLRSTAETTSYLREFDVPSSMFAADEVMPFYLFVVVLTVLLPALELPERIKRQGFPKSGEAESCSRHYPPQGGI